MSAIQTEQKPEYGNAMINSLVYIFLSFFGAIWHVVLRKRGGILVISTTLCASEDVEPIMSASNSVSMSLESSLVTLLFVEIQIHNVSGDALYSAIATLSHLRSGMNRKGCTKSQLRI